jgi:hypothetical protein
MAAAPPPPVGGSSVAELVGADEDSVDGVDDAVVTDSDGVGDGVREGDPVGFEESAPDGLSAVGVVSGRSSSHPRATPTSRTAAASRAGNTHERRSAGTSVWTAVSTASGPGVGSTTVGDDCSSAADGPASR